MNCDRVRRLLGVFDEMDRATREAVQQHMAGCGECAMAWADELEFRRLMASRRHPAASPKARTALLAIPPPGARRALMSSRLASFLPAALLIAGLGAGTVIVVGRQPGAATRAARDAARPPAATIVPRIDRPAGAPPAVANAASIAAAEAEAAGRARDEGADGGDGAARPAVSIPGAPRPAPPAPGPPAVATAPAPAPTPPSGPAPGPGHGGGAPPPTRPPEPTPTPATVVVGTSLRVVAVTDLAGGNAPGCPGCDGIRPDDAAAARERPVARVRVRVTAFTGQNQATPLGNLVLEPVDAGTASGALLVPPAAAYEVTFEGADAGFILCPGQPPSFRLGGAGGADGGILATFRLWQGCPSPALVPPPR